MDLNEYNQQNNENEYRNARNIVEPKSFVRGLLMGALIVVALYFVFPVFRMSVADSGKIIYEVPVVGISGKNGSPEVRTRRISSNDVEVKMDEIFNVLDNNYVTEYDKEQAVEGLYAGLVDSIGDPYTIYMDEKEFIKFREDTEGTYAGIGVSVSVDTTDNSIVIISPFEGYPGANAGMLSGDKIIKVNDTDVSGDKLDQAISIMKGEPGTSVSVTVYRTSTNEILEMDIIRENIDVPTVYAKRLENDIAYIRITQFDRVTYNQFTAAYNEAKTYMKGLIIDLRNNPGGLLSTVTDITDLLVPEGTIVYTEDKSGRKVYTKSDAEHIDVPLLVLVNGYSASASEVLSGAVKDMNVGELVGEKTFGKGLVQNIYPLSDGSAIKITIAKYYTPSGVCIHGEGIAPNYPVEIDTSLSVRISSLTIDEDAQLQKAVEVMNGKMGIAVTN